LSRVARHDYTARRSPLAPLSRIAAGRAGPRIRVGPSARRI